MCCHLPLNPKLGGAKVYIEAAECYRLYGHNVTLVGVDEVCGKESPFLNEEWRIDNYPALLKNYIEINSNNFDVIEFESIYLPFKMTPKLKCILVARSVLLDLHLRKIKIPRFNGLKPLLGQIFKSKKRNEITEKKILQSLKTIINADFTNVPNPDDKLALVLHGVNPDKIIVQPYGIFLRKFNDYKRRAEESIESKQMKIAFVGTFDNRKGAVEFPNIMKALLKLHPEIKFKILGALAMFPTEESINLYLGKTLKDKVEIVGSFTPEDLPSLLSDCALGVFPSYLESFGFGVLEMMALGLPVVGYNSPGVNMLLLEDLCVPAGDSHAVIKKLDHLISDADFRSQCKLKALIKVQSFIYEKQTNYAISLYVKAVSEICHK